MKRSSSETISRGEKSLIYGLPSGAFECLDGDVAICVNANVGRDVERTAHNRLGIEWSVNERAGGSERVIAARSDADNARLRLEHVAGAGQHQRYVLVGDNHHRFQAAQKAIGSPVLGQLDGRPHELTAILLEFRFQPLEQGEGV